MIQVYLDMDQNYYDSIQNLPNEDKIDYLVGVIDEKQNILAKNGNLLSAGEKMKLMELIKAAQKEVKELRAQKVASTKEEQKNAK